MSDQEVPVYIIGGFLEAGKTTFIKKTLELPDFTRGERILLFLCEEGLEEYDLNQCKEQNVELVLVEDMKTLTTAFLEGYHDFYEPEKVILEWNGMWNLNDFLGMALPPSWMVVQHVAVIDAQTYFNYLMNMRDLMIEQFRFADAVFFNRVDETMRKLDFRKTVKIINRPAQLIYESIDGTVDAMADATEEELPFDLEAEVISISEEDYGLWYLDALDYPQKYEGKTVSFLAMPYQDEEMEEDLFFPGRFAMTCCADDIEFIGFPCEAEPWMLEEIKDMPFIILTARVLVGEDEEGEETPFLTALSYQSAEKPEEELVYFT